MCFGFILHAMEEAKAGKRFFYPFPEEQAAQAGVAMASMEGRPVDDKGKGAGKGKSTWHFIHYNLLSAGLQVPNARPPPPPPPIGVPPQPQHYWLPDAYSYKIRQAVE